MSLYNKVCTTLRNIKVFKAFKLKILYAKKCIFSFWGGKEKDVYLWHYL